MLSPPCGGQHVEHGNALSSMAHHKRGRFYSRPHCFCSRTGVLKIHGPQMLISIGMYQPKSCTVGMCIHKDECQLERESLVNHVSVD